MDVRVTNEEWELIREGLSQALQKPIHSKGRPPAPDRGLFEGILWILVTGSRWRDLPKKTYPAKSSCHRRFAQWCRDGSWARVQHHLIRMLGGRGKIDFAEGFVDGTKIKAKKGVLRLASQGPSHFEGKSAHF